MNSIKHVKYFPKIATSISFLLLLAGCILLFLGRKPGLFRNELLLQYIPDFYQHISNTCISYLLYATVGYCWLLLGVKTKYIAALGVVILFVNFAYELWLPVLNTRDIVDAYYGVVGWMIAFIYLMLVKQFGLTKAK